MSIPSQSKIWCTRSNVPISDYSSLTRTVDSVMWSFKEHLLNNASAGSFQGTRSTGSLWTVVSSSDGTSAAASDLWATGTFDPNKFVHAGAGTNHSWMQVRNASLGVDMKIDLNSASPQVFDIKTGLIGCFTGGTVTTAPTVVPGAYTFSTFATQFINSTTIQSGKIMYTHFVADQEGRFFFTVSSPGTGIFVAAQGMTRTIDNHALDVNNIFAIGYTSTDTFPGNFLKTSTTNNFSGIRGLCTAAGTITPFVSASSIDDGNQTMGGTNLWVAGSSPVGAASRKNVDELSNCAYFFPVAVYNHRGTFLTPFSRRGIIPDFYQVIGVNPGKIYPSIASPQWIVAGDYMIPWTSQAPIM